MLSEELLRGLVQSGELRDDVHGRTHRWLERTQATLVGHPRWPRSVVRELHLLSWHPWVSYRQWVVETGRRDLDVEARLATIEFSVEETLWLGLLHADPTTFHPESQLLFEPSLPFRDILRDQSPPEDWLWRYRALVSGLAAEWRELPDWPIDVVDAVRFVSQYVYQAALRLAEPPDVLPDPWNDRSLQLIAGLRTLPIPTQTLEIIEYGIRAPFGRGRGLSASNSDSKQPHQSLVTARGLGETLLLGS